MITEQKKSPETLFSKRENKLGPVNDPTLDQIMTPQKAKLGPENNFTAYTYIYIFTVESITGPS